MWQARYVADLLGGLGIQTELVPLVSSGDVDQRPIDGTRQVGLFTKTIQQAVAEDQADIAVHSLKDLPTELDNRFQLAAIPPRETVVDSLVSTGGFWLQQVPPGSRIGTGSRRRMSQILSLRSDLQVLPIRGNVQTRLSKLESGEFDAIILAEAGILRLGLADLPRTRFNLDEMIPAPGQGALGIEVRANDAYAVQAVQKLDDGESRVAVTAERVLLSRLHGGCLAPIAAYASVRQTILSLHARVLNHDGSQLLDETAECTLPEDPSAWVAAGTRLGEDVSEQLIARGAIALISEQRES